VLATVVVGVVARSGRATVGGVHVREREGSVGRLRDGSRVQKLLNAMCWRDFRDHAVADLEGIDRSRINSSGLALAILPKRAKTGAE
jgi:hypothetical protein